MSKTPIICALVMALGAGPAYAKPKPINGQYKCNGTATAKVDPNAAGVAPTSLTKPVKGKMRVANTGAFELDILTYGWQNSMVGGFPIEYQPYPDVKMGGNAYYKGLSRGCQIFIMWQDARGTQNKSGRKVTLDIKQTYSCTDSLIFYVDRYELTCKR